MKASTLSAATAAISRRLTPDDEPPEARRGRLAAAAELALWIAIAIARIVFEILYALVGIAAAPFAWAADRIGGRRGPTAREFAEAVVAAPPPQPPVVRTRPPTPLADLIRAHARIREFRWRDQPTPAPMPPDVAAWYESLRHEQRKTAACVDRVRLERWIAACRAGEMTDGPGDLPPIRPIPVLPFPSYAGANGKAGGKAGGKGSIRVEPVSAELAAVLAEHKIDLDYGYAAGGRR